MEDWKDLEIGNIPSDIMTAKYEFQYFETGEKISEWRDFDGFIEVLFRDIRRGLAKYRYRLKPLKPIMITQNELEIIALYYTHYLGKNTLPESDDVEKRIGRPVEIIEK